MINLKTFMLFKKCSLILLVTVSLSFPVNCSLAQSVNESVQQYLEQQNVNGFKLYDIKGMISFYQNRGFQPIWLKGERFNKSAKKMIDVLGDSWEHGFNPDNYAFSELKNSKNTKKLVSPNEMEMLLTAAVVRYGRDLTSMRVPPSELGQKAKFWQKPLSAAVILDYVSNSKDIDRAVERIAPQSNIYNALQAEMKKLLKEIEKGDETETILPIILRKTIRPGDSSAIIQDVRYRLKAPKVSSSQDPAVYDDELSQHVMRFQEESGLKADGIIGRKTAEALNKTLDKKLEQVLANMERVRWVKPETSGKYLVVNIPAQTLWAIDDHKVVEEMPVIIGRTKRQTNSFTTHVSGVRFNPTWTVPETIKFEDYLPKLIEDPNYLNDKGVEFFWGPRSEELTLPPESIQWEFLSKSDIKAIRMVQGPSPSNPLGRVRLHMPNQYNIYLHDTNNRGKFDRGDRALSSGCVRMSDPKKIANFVLSENKKWSNDKMNELLDEGEMVDVWARKKTPVYLLYQTMWLNDDQEVVYGRDVYDKDSNLIRVLKKYNAVFSME